MTAITVLPAGLIMMTAFTRIIIVLAILRQALGTAQTPSSQVLLGLALFLTFFVMTPVFERVNEVALEPYMSEELGSKEALSAGSEPIRSFMLAHTREADLAVFAEISGAPPVESRDDIAFSLLMPAFVTSELKTAFQIGFLIFIPFLIIDLVLASVLDVHGYDDVVTTHHLVPFQNNVVRSGRRLGVDHGHPRLELLSVEGPAREIAPDRHRNSTEMNRINQLTVRRLVVGEIHFAPARIEIAQAGLTRSLPHTFVGERT